MAEDKTTEVGNSETAGDSQSSDQSQQSAVDLAALQKRLEATEAQLRGFQKGNDKVNARVEKHAQIASGAQIERIAELTKAGKTSAEIQRELLLDDLLAGAKTAAPASPELGKVQEDVSENEDSVINRTVKELKLDPNNKDVAEAVRTKNFAAIINLAVSKSTVPDPDATTEPPLNSKEKVSDEAGKKALQTAYDKELAELQKQAMGRRVPPAALANLKLAYRKKGLDIH